MRGHLSLHCTLTPSQNNFKYFCAQFMDVHGSLMRMLCQDLHECHRPRPVPLSRFPSGRESEGLSDSLEVRDLPTFTTIGLQVMIA